MLSRYSARSLKVIPHPDYNYTVKGVKIVDNTIKTAGSAVRLTDVSGIFIGSNDISYDYDRYNYSMDLIWLSESSQVTVTKNKLTGTKQNSVYISGGSGNEVSSNTIKSQACREFMFQAVLIKIPYQAIL